MTSMFRAMNESLSNDPYSKLWNNEKTKVWITGYLEEVSKEEVHTHCVRNRFFLDKVKQLFKENKIDILINFGSGFSMYPFLLDELITHIEIDKLEVVDYKKRKVSNWMETGKLPKRNIHFIGADFGENYERKLYKEIQKIKKNKKSFVLIEGVLFFLNMNQANKIFDFFDSIQNIGDYVGSVSFNHSIKETKAFIKLLNFLNKRISSTSKDNYLTLEGTFYQEKLKYKIKEHKDYFLYSKELNNNIKLNITDVLNENFYLLEKIKA